VHRADPRLKVFAMGVGSLTVTWFASWTAVGAGWAVLVAVFLLARLPLGVLPVPPRFLRLMLTISGGFALLGGNLPAFLRFTALTYLLVLSGLLLVWTTPLAALGAGLGWYLRPFRRLRLVDDVALALAIGVRSVPLLVEEARTLDAAWRSRRPVPPKGWRAQRDDAVDVLSSALVAAVRRARDLGEAIATRGGPGSGGPVR
jgi:energy-coupling factor transport system permease protein